MKIQNWAVVVLSFNSSTREAGAVVLWVQDQPSLQSESLDSQDYAEKLCLKNQT